MTKDQIMDKLQWAFDLGYSLYPRALARDAVDPLLVGHRGVFGHPQIRENTLEAFDLAVAHGGAIEFDIHLTRDNVVVVHHDLTLERVHQVPFAIRDLTLAQLQEVAPAVPTFDEVLERFGHGCPHYFIEPKVHDLASREILLRELARSLDRGRLFGCSTLISTDPTMLDLARLRQPGLAKILVFMISGREAERYARAHGDTGLAGWYFSFPHGSRTFLEDRGLHMGVGHIDYINTHRHYRNLGFRYHFTNRIDRLTKPVEPLTLPVPSPSLVGAAG